MAETLETAITTDLTLDYDETVEFEFDSDVPIEFELESGVLIDFEIGNDVPIDYTFTTCALGAEDGDWPWEVIVRTQPSPDPEMVVVSDMT